MGASRRDPPRRPLEGQEQDPPQEALVPGEEVMDSENQAQSDGVEHTV